MTGLYDLAALKVPEGEVIEAKVNGALIWKRYLARYVSLGDSIAAGHSINYEWASDYGERSQYGVNGRAYTSIVPGSYTDLMRSGLAGIYGNGRVLATSFARSGDTTADMMAKLDHEAVRSAIAKADLVTVCIGANDVLQPALMEVEKYIATGDLSNAEAIIEKNMAALADDSNANSYASLLNKLESINPNAKFAFMTIYNPYKYLWVDEGANGFFAPMLSFIPSLEFTVPIVNYTIDVSGLIKAGLLSTTPFQLVFNRVNGLCDWAEYRVNRLNEIIRGKVNAKAAANPNFRIAEVKAAFDVVPDRPSGAALQYNDLVNVEFTRGYNTWLMDWDALWRNSDPYTFWFNLAAGHIKWSFAWPSGNPMDYLNFDLEGFASELIVQVVEKVIIPNVDPHPEYDGHEVICGSFADILG